MRSNYNQIGCYVQQATKRNKDVAVKNLRGININKLFMPSVANRVGLDLSKYKIVSKYQFAFNPMHVGRDEMLPISMLAVDEPVIVSPAYTVFEIEDHEKLDPEYLMMWCRRSEFDRNAWFTTDSTVRGGFSWSDFCEMRLPVPSIDKQREIVREYNVVVNRMNLNEQLNKKLEETAQAIYRNYFVDHIEADVTEELGEFIDFNPKHSIKKSENTSYVEMADLLEFHMTIRGHIQRPFTAGSKFKNDDTLLARITPCLENGKTAFISTLKKDEVAYGSTEFIVMRARNGASPYWVYCLARDYNFREYAISSMIGSSGRQRVHSEYLEIYEVAKFTTAKMQEFHERMVPIFSRIKRNSIQNSRLDELSQLLLSGISSHKIGVVRS